MSRCEDWPEKLELFIEEKRHQPFDWRANNCCFFACDWLAILTGKDPAHGLRERVTSDLSAARVLKQRGGVEGIAEAECKRRKWPDVPVPYAMRGDLMLIDTPQGPALGVCLGADVAFAGLGGVSFVTLAGCRRAWRVG